MLSIRSELAPLLLGGALPILAVSLPVLASDALPPALLLLDRAPDDVAMAEVQVRLVRARLGSAWQVEDASFLPGIARPDTACDPEARPANADMVLGGLRAGTARFFDETDVEGATGLLQASIDRFLDAPCVLGGDPAGRSESVAASVLLVRLHLLSGRPEAAADLGRRLLRTFGADELASVDVPPEVTAFLGRVRDDAAAGAVPFEIAVEGVAPGSTVLFDGRPLPASPAAMRVARGRHALTVMAGEVARTWPVAVEGPGRVSLDVGLAVLVGPGPQGTLVAEAPGGMPGDLERRLSAVTGRTVLRITGTGTGGPVEAFVAAEPGRKVPVVRVLRLEGAGAPSGGPVLAHVSGPLVRRKSWPWPFVTGAVSAGLLAAGIVLNVQANQAADEVNSGVNRLGDWRTRRTASIACYALAAAAGAGTIVLAILGRPGPEHVALSPLPGGVAIGYESSF